MTLKASAWVLTAALAFASATPVFAYLKFGVTINGRAVTLKWANTPARYYVTDRGASGLSPTDIQAAVGRAFATWQAVPTASISYQFGGFTGALPGEDDGMSTLGFVSRPELSRVLASTSLLLDNATGELLESDIFFNAAFAWSTSPGGQSGRFYLDAIALHEIGHLRRPHHLDVRRARRRAAGGAG